MLGTTVKVRRKSWTVSSGILVLVVVAGLTVGCSRKKPIVPSPAPPTKSQPAPDAQRPGDVHPFPDPTFLVLVWTETTPPGARIVRASNGHVLGWTPEIVELSQSAEPVQLRFELEGYLPVTREVSALSDGELKVMLEPIPKGRHPATKKSKGSGAHKNSN
jgi:serine/threonine-protein kinase